MLLVPGDEDCRSVGSFFKNPVLSETQFDDLAKRAAAKALEIPSYPARAEPNIKTQHVKAQHKVSAAWLVEHSGFCKGYQEGPAGISHKHALALVNRGGAKASDIIALQREIQRGVNDAWGIQLEPEPVFVGF
jgi:UDP-N-acetylmuramate dehydrogenase